MSITLPVFAIQRLRVETDGDGITTLVGVHGCPLRCKYCINKMVWEEKTVVRQFTEKELYETVKVDDLYFQATNGGITFGGGEAILYSPFIRSFKEQYGARWNIVLETALNVPREFVEEAARGVDFFIMDCKDFNNTIYQSYTGKSSVQMVENLKYLLHTVGPERVRVKVPHIPEYNTEVDWKKTIAKLQEIGVTQIQELDYMTEEIHLT